MDGIRIGISSCLLGNNVRYDGGHQLDRWLRDTLGRYVTYLPVCPEVELGLPTPRPALRLVGEDPATARLVFSRGGEDITGRMTAWAMARLAELAQEDLCGFIFKARSPSSGMERVRLYDKSGMPHRKGVGLFARLFMERFPLVPVEEDGRLHDPALKENFVECVFAFKAFRQALAVGGRRALIDFHSRHKLQLMAHSVEIPRTMGKLVAQAGQLTPAELAAQYQPLLMRAMRTPTTVCKQLNVLQHVLGYFKRQLSADEKAEALDLFAQYRQELVPLLVPITLLNHYVRKYGEPYLSEQVYLHPHPLDLKLRLVL